MILQKMLEGKKRVDDRERKKEELRQQRKDEVLKKVVDRKGAAPKLEAQP